MKQNSEKVLLCLYMSVHIAIRVKTSNFLSLWFLKGKVTLGNFALCS